jgi:hypothetical protein
MVDEDESVDLSFGLEGKVTVVTDSSHTIRDGPYPGCSRRIPAIRASTSAPI